MVSGVKRRNCKCLKNVISKKSLTQDNKKELFTSQHFISLYDFPIPNKKLQIFPALTFSLPLTLKYMSSLHISQTVKSEP